MKISDFLGQTWDINCIGCAISQSQMIPPGGIIGENDSFYLHQDPEVPIAGFLIIGSKRHVQSINQLTEAEYSDFNSIVWRGRKLLGGMPDIQSVTIVQEERSAHFHLWLFPWKAWMIERYGKNSLEHVRAIMADAKTAKNAPESKEDVMEAVEMLKGG